MIYATLGTEFVELFSQMSVMAFVCLLIGVVLIIVEFFQPISGILITCGSILIIVGVALRMIFGGTFAMMFFMFFFCVAICLCAHIIMLFRHKKDWLTHSLALSIYDEENNKK